MRKIKKTATDNGVAGGFTYGTAWLWGFIKIFIIGYGDIYSISSLMSILAIVISLIWIAFLSLYTAIIVNEFIQEFQRRKLLVKDGGSLTSGDDTEEANNIKKLMTENNN